MKLIERLLLWCDHQRNAARWQEWTPERALGREGEDLAHRFLQQKGYYVVARNYRTPTGSGELDVVARQGETLVFVEVKSRRSEEFGAPDRNIDSSKKWKMIRAARDYLRRSGHDPVQVRFDTVSVVLGDDGAEIRHGVGVFSMPDAV